MNDTEQEGPFCTELWCNITYWLTHSDSALMYCSRLLHNVRRVNHIRTVKNVSVILLVAVRLMTARNAPLYLTFLLMASFYAITVCGKTPTTFRSASVYDLYHEVPVEGCIPVATCSYVDEKVKIHKRMTWKWIFILWSRWPCWHFLHFGRITRLNIFRHYVSSHSDPSKELSFGKLRDFDFVCSFFPVSSGVSRK